MHRFYAPHYTSGSSLTITQPSEIHHIKNVLRLKKGVEIQFFNGKGVEGQGSIEHISPKEINISVISSKKNIDASLYTVLACAMPKKSKFETIIEKATELGVDEIIPLTTKNTEVRLKGERLINKQRRFETVALNAAKQSKRSKIPIIHTISTFKSVIENQAEKAVLLMPGLIEARERLLDVLPLKKSKVVIFIGPEGDFSAEEYKLAQEHNAIIVSLGDHVLKVETAALVALSTIQLYYS